MMTNMGANPHLQDYNGKTEFDRRSLYGLKNVPKVESVFFQLHEFNNDMPPAWEYRTGVFSKGHFGQVRGRGGEGTVIEGLWQNQIPAAFKFVEIRNQKFIWNVKDALADLNERLSEMNSMRTTKGSAILEFDGHYR